MRRACFVIAAVVLLGAGAALGAVKVGSSITVRVMSAKLMKQPKFIGATAATLSRGDQLAVREIKGDWYRVEGRGTGWIHKTSVMEGKVALSTTPGSGGSGASREEVELAGRGFTPQIESSYRSANPELDFGHVDVIEQVTIDPEELEAFVGQGGLR
jgi:hypothetical protein